VLLELDDAPFGRARHTLVAPAIVKHEKLLGLSRTALLGRLRDRDLQPILVAPLYEHAFELPRLQHTLRVEDHVAARERPEAPGLECAELCRAQCVDPDRLRQHARLRYDPVGQQRQYACNHQREEDDGPVDGERADAAGGHGCHLALVVEASE
jgi:hypothetical protein